MEINGILLVNKAVGPSSARIVGHLKKRLKLKKVGHAGTLDPLAEGLLIVLVGQATKKFSEFQKMPKSYEAEIEFGKVTETDDREGKIISEYKETFTLEKKTLEKVLGRFTGEINQVPPSFSALKIKGEPAYKLSRRGETPKLKPRKAIVYQMEILDLKDKRAKIFFKVSSGTYIRSLARDIGKALGYGGYLYSLKRTAIGDYKLKDAKDPEKIILEVTLKE